MSTGVNDGVTGRGAGNSEYRDPDDDVLCEHGPGDGGQYDVLPLRDVGMAQEGLSTGRDRHDVNNTPSYLSPCKTII